MESSQTGVVSWQERLRQRWRTFRAQPQAEQAHAGLLASFSLYIFLFATGYGAREVLPLLCLPFLLWWYAVAWEKSVLRRFKAWWLFLFFFMLALWGTVTSTDVWASFLHVGRHVNKGFILPFIAMECVRKERDLRWLVTVMTAAFCWQGVDGVWQFCTGYDFVDGTPLVSGRLTGSLNDYRVGNYLALLFIPASGVWYALRRRWPCVRALLVAALLFGPGLFMLYYTYTRNAYVTVIVGVMLLMLLRGGRPDWRLVSLVGCVALMWLASQWSRFAVDVIARDGRWDLWNIALEVARHNPLTGVGFGQYNTAFRALGLVPLRDPVTISHPHSIYLQFLCESGVIGLTLGCIFLFGMAYWGYRHICGPLRAELALSRKGLTQRCYWRLTGLLWCGWGAYLLSGVAGHDYYRMWWLSLVMSNLGIMIGAVVNGPFVRTSGKNDAA